MKLIGERLHSLFGGIAASPIIESSVIRYRSLSDRDKKSLRLLSGFLIALILIYGVLVPAYGFSKNSRLAMLSANEEFNWLKQQEGEAREIPSQGKYCR